MDKILGNDLDDPQTVGFPMDTPFFLEDFGLPHVREKHIWDTQDPMIIVHPRPADRAKTGLQDNSEAPRDHFDAPPSAHRQHFREIKKASVIYPYASHGAGIFTYMTEPFVG